MSRTSWWRRLIGRKSRAGHDVVQMDRETLDATTGYLEEFVATRHGVEVWVEAPTNFNRPSVLLIAYDGEWTRRSVPSVPWGHDFAEQRQLASYDAGVVPYPDRMREWNRRNKS